MRINPDELHARLIAAREELREWIAGAMSFHNQLHGSVTGDYENQAIHTAYADNAQKIAIAAIVTALTAEWQAAREDRPVPQLGLVSTLSRNPGGEWWVTTRKDGVPYSGMPLDMFLKEDQNG